MPIVFGNPNSPRPRSGCAPRLMIGAVIALISIAGYFFSTQKNPFTGESQRVKISPAQEVQLGLQAAPEMAAQMGGTVPPNDPQSQLVSAVGNRLAASIDIPDNPYRFNFHLLADTQTINAFALPGGQIFITRALLDKLTTQAQLAGVLGHEIGHVINRHSAEHMAKSDLFQGLVQATAVGTESMSAAQIAQVAAQMRMLSYGRQDELESDQWGLQLMVKNNYDPRAQIEVMHILKEATGNSPRAPNFMATHPDPAARAEAINAWLQKNYPNGIPPNLTPGQTLRRLHAQ